MSDVADPELAAWIRRHLPLRDAGHPQANAPARLRELADVLEAHPSMADVVVVVLATPRDARPDVRVLGRPVNTAEVAGLLMKAAVQASAE